MDEEAELAQLQRRAYGPDADIDAAGIARLTELQERARTARPMSAGASARDARPTPPEAVVEPEPAPVHVLLDGAQPDAEPDVDAGREPEPIAHEHRPVWRRTAVLVAAGAVAGIALTAGIGAMVSADAPDAVLRTQDDPRPNEFFRGLGEMTTFELYAGIDVRSLTLDGDVCLFISYQTGGGGTGTAFADASCVPQGLQPATEVWIGESPLGWSTGTLDGFEAGTYLRFELDGDVVKVWRHDPPAPTAAPAGS